MLEHERSLLWAWGICQGRPGTGVQSGPEFNGELAEQGGPLRRRTRAMLWLPMNSDMDFMAMALEEAKRAASAGEVPVGAVMVMNGNVLARGGNRTIRDCDPTAHAEIVVLREAARAVVNYRLAETTLYVTIEPCSMCAGAMIQARIARLVYGADDPKGGAVRSCFEVLSNARLNHQVEVTAGVLAAECAGVLQSFFASRR
jgi:tRNA(adenine34) deaminase